LPRVWIKASAPASAGTFTESVCEQTNVVALLSSVGGNRRQSNGGWRASFVRIAEPNMVLNDLTEGRAYRVKLHTHAGTTITRRVRVKDRSRARPLVRV